MCDNPYHCDCSILWFRDWLQARGQNVANLPKETRCNSTKELALKPIVKLSNNTFVCSSSDSPSLPLFFIFLLATLVFFMCSR
ncbi:LRRCT domain-containing protein [Caerostris extrusa]|uniref:LRRCT domain-containing protein n=1 Tax=Caerostris extrusa TaxID=172846 RepID=A0AAV4P8L3_CAEEX|nr:LRRCT domain-containing protein [Caerostris extrusa]